MLEAPALDEDAYASALRAAADHQSACQVAVDHLALSPHFKPSVYLERGGRLRCQALRTYRQAFDGMAPGAGMIGRAFTTGVLQVSTDVGSDPDYLEITAGVRAEACVPLLAAGQPIGVLSVESLAVLSPADVAHVVAVAEALAGRLLELGGALRETPAERLVRHATKLTGTQSRSRIERTLLHAASDVVEMDTAVLLEDATVVDAVGPLAIAMRQLPADALRTAAGLVTAGTSCFTIGEPAGDDFAGLGQLRDAGAAALMVVAVSAEPGRVLLVADRQPRPIRTEMIELLELLCAHGAGSLRLADLVDDLRVQATTDALTGLGHHRAFHARMDTAEPLAILVVDLDGFKGVNDRDGHAAGDRVLREVAAVLRGIVRATDDVFRIGGDEFAVFSPAASAAEALALGERIVLEVRDRTAVTASVGAARSAAGERATETLLRADRALYDAKAAGRDGARLAA